ncbi:hypothetical protein GCM10029964_072400 [Kibdelosporangium lantanae]
MRRTGAAEDVVTVLDHLARPPVLGRVQVHRDAPAGVAVAERGPPIVAGQAFHPSERYGLEHDPVVAEVLLPLPVPGIAGQVRFDDVLDRPM